MMIGSLNLIIGKRHGRGEYIYLDGSKFDGNWDNDKINGEGTSWYPNGNRFVGQWVNGKINGSGTLFLATGDKYTGGKFMITSVISWFRTTSYIIFHHLSNVSFQNGRTGNDMEMVHTFTAMVTVMMENGAMMNDMVMVR